jgi:hypothetical protein
MGRCDGYVKTQKPCSNKSCENLVWKGKYCSKCRQRLRRRGDINTVLPKKRTYFFNEKIFDTWNRESAWMLGWAITDGSICSKKSIGLTFDLKDKEPLEIMRNIVNHDKEIVSINDGRHWRLTLKSVYLINRLRELGVGPAKSLTIKCPDNIPTEFISHFVRGVIEGDGSVIVDKNSNRLFVNINSASQAFIDGVEKLIPFKGSKFVQMKNRINPLWRLSYTGKTALALCNWIYQDSTDLRLTRKYQKFLQYGA